MRFTFTKQRRPGARAEYVKQIVYEMMQCTKTINHRASLMPWEDSIGFKNLNGNEIQLISPNLMMEYIDTPQVQGDYNDGEMYYGNRIRIAIEMNKVEFVNKWNFKKYDRIEGAPFKN